MNLPVSADEDQIKRAFRKLALQYHPDKNKTTAAPQRFSDIHEAYTVLKDPVKRAAYHYQRHASGHWHESKPTAQNATDVLQASILLKNKVRQADPFRIDLDKLSFDIQELLTDHTISLLLHSPDDAVNRQVVGNILTILRLVPLFLASGSIASLQRIGENDALIRDEINVFLKHAKNDYYWNKYKMFIALLAAVVCCLAIFLSVKKTA